MRSVNTRKHIEDFRAVGPDEFNNQNPLGDPAHANPEEGDWAPTIRRAMSLMYAQGLVNAGDMHAATIVFGRDYAEYHIMGMIPVFSSMEGMSPGVKLTFVSVTDGLVLMDSTMSVIPNGYGMDHMRGLACPAYISISNLSISHEGMASGRAIVSARPYRAHQLDIQGCGWHGIHNLPGSDGSILSSLSVSNCGYIPGADLDRITEWNTNGDREYGAGIRVDSPNCTVNDLRLTFNAWTQIWDSGGNRFNGAKLRVNEAGSDAGRTYALHSIVYTQEMLDIYNGAAQWLLDNPPGGALWGSDYEGWLATEGLAKADMINFAPYKTPVGEVVNNAVISHDSGYTSSFNNVSCDTALSELTGEPMLPYVTLGKASSLTGQGLQRSGVDGGYVMSHDAIHMDGVTFRNPLPLAPSPEGVPETPRAGIALGQNGADLSWQPPKDSPDVHKDLRWSYVGWHGNERSNGGPYGAGSYLMTVGGALPVLTVTAGDGANVGVPGVPAGIPMFPRGLYIGESRVMFFPNAAAMNSSPPRAAGDFAIVGGDPGALGTNFYTSYSHNGSYAWRAVAPTVAVP
jgi:hypothetical protein